MRSKEVSKKSGKHFPQRVRLDIESPGKALHAPETGRRQGSGKVFPTFQYTRREYVVKTYDVGVGSGSTIRSFVLLLMVTSFLSGCSRDEGAAMHGTVTVAMESTAVNSLIYIAEEKGFFSANGLEMVIDDSHPSGAAATEWMMEGGADVSTTAELAIVRYAFGRKQALTIGSIDMFTHMKLIVRKDLGIEDASDLQGKKVGVPTGTAADFKLGRFLDLHGIDSRKVTIVDTQFPQAVDALIDGTVDAVVTWQPNVMALVDRLGDDAGVWEVQSGQPMYGVLVTTESWVREHPDLVQRFMKSLVQAEEFLVRNEDHGGAIIRKRLEYDDRYFRTIWPEHQFSVRLDQSLILAMEDQARWMISNSLTDEKKVPDFLESIHTSSLKAIKPGAVNIIRGIGKP
jgi:NitT/TauT family transport system substrate-binding protein